MLKPSSQTTGGGGTIPRGRLEITGARFDKWLPVDAQGNPYPSQYGGESERMVAFLEFTNRESGEVYSDRRYSVGAYSRYTPLSNDGTTLSNQISDACQLAKLINALCAHPCNLPEEILTDQITSLVGIVAEWDLKDNLVMPSMLYEVPGQGTGEMGPAEKAVAAAHAQMDLDSIALEIAKDLVAKGPCKRQDLQKACFDRADISQETKVSLMTHVMGEAFTATLASETGIVLNGEDLVAPSS